jgi:hypothetical protein
MPSAITNDTEIAFLGIAERLSKVREGETPLVKWNMIGIKSIVPLFFTPFSIYGWRFVFALRHLTSEREDVTIKIKDEDGCEIGYIDTNINTNVSEISQLPLPITSSAGRRYVTGFHGSEGWHFVCLSIDTTAFIITHAGRYFLTVRRRNDTEEIRIRLYAR